MKHPLNLWRRIASVTADLSIIYCLAELAHRGAWIFVPVNAGVVFIGVFFLYYFLCYLFLEGRTAGKILFGLRLVGTREPGLTVRQIINRELVCKTFIGMIVPMALIIGIFEYGRESTVPALELLTQIAVFLLILIISLTAFLIKRKTWWDRVSGTALLMQPKVARRPFYLVLMAVSVLMLATVWIALFPFVSGSTNIRNSYLPKYPISRDVRKYADFIRENKQDPVDYIFNLFDRYDIVVLSERMHPEYTQYQFITSVIRDPRFEKKVGNLFTECGSVSFQDTLNTLLRTSFDSRDSLDLRTALLQRNSNAIWPLWDNTNLFDLLESVNLLNAGLSDSTKINWYFTDLPVDWRHMNHQKFIAAYTDIQRDSFMASQVINRCDDDLRQKHRHKALVIMNTRHGYGLTRNSHPGSFRKEYGNSTAAYLINRFPGQSGQRHVEYRFAPVWLCPHPGAKRKMGCCLFPAGQSRRRF